MAENGSEYIVRSQADSCASDGRPERMDRGETGLNVRALPRATAAVSPFEVTFTLEQHRGRGVSVPAWCATGESSPREVV